MRCAITHELAVNRFEGAPDWGYYVLATGIGLALFLLGWLGHDAGAPTGVGAFRVKGSVRRIVRYDDGPIRPEIVAIQIWGVGIVALTVVAILEEQILGSRELPLMEWWFIWFGFLVFGLDIALYVIAWLRRSRGAR
jgi:hypothetical protein